MINFSVFFVSIRFHSFPCAHAHGLEISPRWGYGASEISAFYVGGRAAAVVILVDVLTFYAWGVATGIVFGFEVLSANIWSIAGVRDAIVDFSAGDRWELGGGVDGGVGLLFDFI